MSEGGPEGLNFLLGLLYLGLAGFAVWMWVDALFMRPGRDWRAIGRSKVTFFVAWYVGGLLTVGLVPMGLAIWYYRTIRPQLQQHANESSHWTPLRTLACTDCGHPNPTSARFCAYCGTSTAATQ